MDTVNFLQNQFIRRLFTVAAVLALTAAIMYMMWNHAFPAMFDHMIEKSKNFKIG